MQNSTSLSVFPRIGITHGDLNGVGYEIILKAFADLRLLSGVSPLLYGQSKVFSYYKKNLSMEGFNYSLTRNARQVWNEKFNILNIVEYELKIDPGKPTELSGEMAVKSLKMAANDLYMGLIDAMVMAPANPANMKSDSYNFSSQLSYLSSVFQTDKPMLMAVSDRLKIGVVTDNLPLRQAAESITNEMLLRKLEVFNEALRMDFGLVAPKIAVLALNPLADGLDLFGTEDSVTIQPVLTEARDKGIFGFGPFSADTFFVKEDWRKYDGILAMYHDQAMLPFNLLSVDGGAYYVAGLPVVCTAPVSSCDYEHCNMNQASPDSFRKAFYLACDIVKRRKENETP